MCPEDSVPQPPTTPAGRVPESDRARGRPRDGPDGPRPVCGYRECEPLGQRSANVRGEAGCRPGCRRAGTGGKACEGTPPQRASVLDVGRRSHKTRTEQPGSRERINRQHPCAGGGIGRRAGFRFQCPKGRGGSTPPSRTDETPGLRRNPETGGLSLCLSRCWLCHGGAGAPERPGCLRATSHAWPWGAWRLLPVPATGLAVAVLGRGTAEPGRLSAPRLDCPGRGQAARRAARALALAAASSWALSREVSYSGISSAIAGLLGAMVSSGTMKSTSRPSPPFSTASR